MQKIITRLIFVFLFAALSGCLSMQEIERLSNTETSQKIFLSSDESKAVVPILQQGYKEVLTKNGYPTSVWKEESLVEKPWTKFVIVLGPSAPITNFLEKEQFVQSEFGVTILERENIAPGAPKMLGGFLPEPKKFQAEILRTSKPVPIVTPAKYEVIQTKPLVVRKLRRR